MKTNHNGHTLGNLTNRVMAVLALLVSLGAHALR